MRLQFFPIASVFIWAFLVKQGSCSGNVEFGGDLVETDQDSHILQRRSVKSKKETTLHDNARPNQPNTPLQKNGRDLKNEQGKAKTAPSKKDQTKKQPTTARKSIQQETIKKEEQKVQPPRTSDKLHSVKEKSKKSSDKKVTTTNDKNEPKRESLRLEQTTQATANNAPNTKNEGEEVKTTPNSDTLSQYNYNGSPKWIKFAAFSQP